MNMTPLHVLDTLNHIVSEIKLNNLSIFAGAGLSVASGYVDWKKLVTRFCDILDIDVGDDLTNIAQYYEEKYNRQSMCESIIREFNSFNNKDDNYNLNLIASLPVDSYWTTNYDSLIEDKLSEFGRPYQKIIDQSQFKNRKPFTEVRVYKMHGDKDVPDNVVITKNDYDTYDENRWFFTQALLYELVTKTFLFIGFSFSDPNLDRILNIIKINFKGISPKNHYCFMRCVQRSDYDDEESYIKDRNYQTLKIDNMFKFGINTILVDDFSQITVMLKYLSERLKFDNVFISGAKYGENKDTEYSFNESEREFMISLSSKLIEKGYNIYTGFGRGVGNYIVSGAITAINKLDINSIDDRLNIHPMITVDGVLLSDEKKILREKMISDCKHIICMYGHLDKGVSKDEDGVYLEYSIAKGFGKHIIALPHTGSSAEEIYKYLNDSVKVFNNIDNNEQIINRVLELLEAENDKLDNKLKSELKINRFTNVFISFRYNLNLTQANEIKGYINSKENYYVINTEEEKINDKNKIYNWIDEKLLNSDVIVLLIDKETLSSEYVKHELQNSIELGKSFVTVFIDDSVKNPLADINYTGELSCIYELFPTCSYTEINSTEDIINLIDKARDIGRSLDVPMLKKIICDKKD